MTAPVPVAGNAIAAESDASASSISISSFANNITTGNYLITFVNWYGVTTPDDAVVTDSAGNTWTRSETGPTLSSGDATGITCYYCKITAGGGTKPTVTASFYTDTGHGTPKSVSYPAISVSEWSGIKSSAPLDQHGTNYQGGAGIGNGTDVLVCPSAAVTPSTDDQLVMAFVSQASGANGNSSHMSAGTGFTELTRTVTVSPSGYFYQVEYKLQGVAAAVQGLWSQSGTTSPSIVQSLIVTFKPEPAGGASIVPILIPQYRRRKL